MAAIVLAGGRAARMHGADKAFLKIRSETLIKRQLRLLRAVFKKIIIVTNSPQKYRSFKNIKIIPDKVICRGPLGGIFSGLYASKDKYNLVIACDMPFINTALIKYMRKASPGFDVVIPKINGRYQPLFCLYSKECLKYIKNLLDKKIHKIISFFPEVKVRQIGEEEVSQFGNPEFIFTNINTERDLSLAKSKETGLIMPKN